MNLRGSFHTERKCPIPTGPLIKTKLLQPPTLSTLPSLIPSPPRAVMKFQLLVKPCIIAQLVGCNSVLKKGSAPPTLQYHQQVKFETIRSYGLLFLIWRHPQQCIMFECGHILQNKLWRLNCCPHSSGSTVSTYNWSSPWHEECTISQCTFNKLSSNPPCDIQVVLLGKAGPTNIYSFTYLLSWP